MIDVPEELDWITDHECQAPMWIQGRYTGVQIQVCAESKDRGFHVISWTQPTLEILWAMKIS